MTHASGNSTWQDYPSIATLITAARLENIERAIDAPFTCMRRYRTGDQTLTNDTTLPVALNTTDTSMSRGTGLTASGNGIACASAGLYMVFCEVFFFGGSTGNRGLSLGVNGTTTRIFTDPVTATTYRASGGAIVNVPVAGVITLTYYVFSTTQPVIGGNSAADSALTVLRLMA